MSPVNLIDLLWRYILLNKHKSDEISNYIPHMKKESLSINDLENSSHIGSLSFLCFVFWSFWALFLWESTWMFEPQSIWKRKDMSHDRNAFLSFLGGIVSLKNTLSMKASCLLHYIRIIVPPSRDRHHRGTIILAKKI